MTAAAPGEAPGARPGGARPASGEAAAGVDAGFVAARLREVADLLEQQQANPFRVRAYRRAADAIEATAPDLRDLFAREGVEGLIALPGVGPRIGAAIAEMLRTGRWAQLDRLRGTLDPERLFNARGEAWLPVLHTERGEWHFTALFSNTARAHQLGRTRDWTVIYFHHPGEPEGQRTVVTETQGPLAGKRVVRGREADCERHYRRGDEAAAVADVPGARRR